MSLSIRRLKSSALRKISSVMCLPFTVESSMQCEHPREQKLVTLISISGIPTFDLHRRLHTPVEVDSPLRRGLEFAKPLLEIGGCVMPGAFEVLDHALEDARIGGVHDELRRHGFGCCV